MTTDLRALVADLDEILEVIYLMTRKPQDRQDLMDLAGRIKLRAEHAKAALDAHSVQSAYNPGETLSNGAQAGLECVGWEVEYTDNRWRRYGGKGEPPAYMTRRRRIYAGPVGG